MKGLVWQLYEVTEDYRRYRAVYGMDPITHEPIYAVKTEILAPAEMLESVKQERNDTEGTRWSSGMGSDKNGNMPLVKVASIPMNKWAAELAPRAKEKDFKKWWLARPENEAFRTRKGDL